MPQDFLTYRERFTALYNAVKELHHNSPLKHRGHSLEHDVSVAQMAAHIAPDDRTEEKAWVAGMIHSTDRLLTNDKLLPATLRQLLSFLPEGYFTLQEVEEIFEAAIEHDGPNGEDDSLTLITLRDADRLVNIQPLVISRSGQLHDKVPAIEVEHMKHGDPYARSNPASTYREPCNLLDNLRSCLEWEHHPRFCLRLPAAKERGKKDFEYLREYIMRSEAPYWEMGIAGVEL